MTAAALRLMSCIGALLLGACAIQEHRPSPDPTIVVGCFGCGHTARTSPDRPDVAAIERVVDAFRTSILTKDKATFMSLFLSGQPEHITWQSVVDDPSLSHIRQTRPQALKARYRPDNNFVAFIDGIVASKTSEEERFSDVRIDTDGEVASVSFDYVYLQDGRPTNHGHEKWLLVRTERGWKIVSVVYTIRLTQAGGGR